jgi:hypothetical protein
VLFGERTIDISLDQDLACRGRRVDGVDMPPSDTSTLLLGLERRRLRALVAGDPEAAEQLHADDYQLITPSGATLSKHEYLDAIASGELNYRAFEVRRRLRSRHSTAWPCCDT